MTSKYIIHLYLIAIKLNKRIDKYLYSIVLLIPLIKQINAQTTWINWHNLIKQLRKCIYCYNLLQYEKQITILLLVLHFTLLIGFFELHLYLKQYFSLVKIMIQNICSKKSVSQPYFSRRVSSGTQSTQTRLARRASHPCISTRLIFDKTNAILYFIVHLIIIFKLSTTDYNFSF